MPQAAIDEIAAWLYAALYEEGISYAVATAIATVAVYAVEAFVAGKISQALAEGQSDDLGAPPPFEAPSGPVPVNVGGLRFSSGSLGGFQSRAAAGWRVFGFADHEKGADYFDE